METSISLKNMENKNKVALVTGASSGIGEALSRELVKRGWLVIGIARSADKLALIKKDLQEAFIPMICDYDGYVDVKQQKREGDGAQAPSLR